MKRFFRQRWTLAVVAIAVIVSIGGVVHAAAGITKAVLYYEESNANKLKTIFNDGEKQEEIGDMLKVVVKGGLFGDGTVFSFTPEINQQINQIDDGTDDDSDQYFAITQVYCGGNTLSLTEPSNRPFYKIDYVLGYDFGDWNEVQNGDNYDTKAGITKITKVGSGGQADEVVHEKRWNTGYDNLNNDDNNNPNVGSDGSSGEKINDILPAECNTGLPRDRFDTRTKNYYKLPDSEKTDIKTIVDAAGGAGGGSASSTDEVDSCRGGALGWVLCPVVDGFTEAIKGAAAIVESLMTFQILADKDNNDKIQAIHTAFVSMANILLIIAFMTIVFSQSTSVGLSNYGIKRMLPRLIMGAIFINLSFFICAFLIDISNIAGNSIIGFMIGAGGGDTSISGAINQVAGGQDSGGTNFFSTGGDLTLGTASVGGLVAGGAAAYAIGPMGLLFLVAILLLAVVVSIFATLLVLIARQVILLALVLVSPLAFAAWLLPNTEQYFRKWWSLFTQQLILFPMIMAVFGASILAASLV